MKNLETVEPRGLSAAVLIKGCSLLVALLTSGCLACNERDFRRQNAEVVQFAWAQAAQFVYRVTVAAPVIVRADQVHFSHLVNLISLCCDQHIGPKF